MELAPEGLPESNDRINANEVAERLSEAQGTPESAETLVDCGAQEEIQDEASTNEAAPLSIEEKRAMVVNALDQILGDKYLVSFYDQDKGLHTLTGRNLNDMELCYMADAINEHRRMH